MNVSCSNANAGQLNNFVESDFELNGDFLPRGNVGYNFWFGKKVNFRRGKCKTYNSYIKFYINDLNRVPEFVATEILYDDSIDISVNGNLIFRGIGNKQDINLNPGDYGCEMDGIFSATNINLKPSLQIGWNTIHIANVVYGAGNVYLNIRAKRLHGCNQDSSYRHFCSEGETQTTGTYLNSNCISGPETRYIKGFPVFKDCWQWQENYSRKGNPYYEKEAMCGQLESEGCGQKSAECTRHNGTFCENQLTTYSCPYQTAARNVSMCGSQMVCPDGNCTSEFGQRYQPATEDFKKAATGMAVASEIAKEFDQDNLTIFNGDAKACRKIWWQFFKLL